jgi:hypothetical protein
VRLYRSFPFDAGAAPHGRGGALFVPTSSGLGRIDNPDLYEVLYVSANPQAAVAESFGRLAVWRPETFVHGSGLPFAIASYEVPDDLLVFDLNDIDALKSIGVTRPTDVVTRDRAKTQAWARMIFVGGRHAGASWWSYYEPDWPVLGLWDRRSVQLAEPPQIITAASAVVQEAAAVIVRQITM